MEKYKPWKYFKDIFSINYKSLKCEGFKTLIFDLDNTIINNRVKDVSTKEIELFKTLKKDGFNIYIVSNSWPWRVKRICNSLGIKGFYLSFKPLTYNIKKVIKDDNLEIKQSILIGDQIFTDVLGAYKAGIKSILVDPIDIYESFITLINRGREDNLINRGDYFE